jgi:indolepyruvate decarboxylase
MATTVVQHVLKRLREIGVTDIFGVPGDYAFPINDAICTDKNIRWIGSCNELNAAYSADGYARIKGVGAVNTTYAVGELSALNGVAGAYAEHLPVFHLVGMPAMSVQSERGMVHHTLGNGEFDLFRRMSEPAVVAQAVMTPQNVAAETERLIFEALHHRRPVYMAFPSDLADQPVLGSARPLPMPRSDAASLKGAVDAIADAVERANSVCVLAGILVARTGQRAALQKMIEAANLPFATMIMDKSTLNEQHPNYVGLYDGALMNEGVRAFVESADLVLNIGSVMSDFSTGAFTANLDPRRVIVIGHHRTQVNGTVYPNVELGDLFAALTKRLPKRDWKKVSPPSPDSVVGSGKDKITAKALYPRWANFLKADDILVAETGTSSMGLGFARLPANATFHNQTLWGSIGWATPAAFGAALAAPKKRTVLITGEGSHQLTAQEIGQFHRFGLKPIIFLLNNNGYLIERMLCKDPDIVYNDLAQWHYADLPHALGCDGWFTTRVKTCGELDAAMAKAAKANTGVYIEIITGEYEASPLAKKLHDSIKTLYK